jgi:GT2 family glycosyltransferase
VASVIDASSDGAEVIVVDQSADGATAEALRGIGHDRVTLIYLPTATRGLSAARNVGAQRATGDALLFTDDDCLVEPGWMNAWNETFAGDPSIAVGFGRVKAPAFETSQGHIPNFDPGDGAHVHGLDVFRAGASTVGMGANMAVRRRVWEELAGFDELLGAGSRFPAAEELDVAYRALRAGYRLAHVGGSSVWHHGYRVRPEASRLVQGYAMATGAMYAKHVRCGDAVAAQLLVLHAGQLLATVIGRAVRRTSPLGLRSLLAYLKGIAASWRCPLDPRLGLYRVREVRLAS